MFMLYAVVLGVLGGFALRGSLDGLTEIRIRWPLLALGGLAIQVVLFSTPLTDTIGDAGAPVYVASSAAVLAVVVRNRRIAGMPIVALGATSNLAAILANGGWMPASRDALLSLGSVIGPEYSNSRVFAAPALPYLTDAFALPRWIPLANVFSVGDLVIGLGVFVAIVAAMHRRPSTASTRNLAAAHDLGAPAG